LPIPSPRHDPEKESHSLKPVAISEKAPGKATLKAERAPQREMENDRKPNPGVSVDKRSQIAMKEEKRKA
jgi:hypothetical protein